MEYSNIPTKYIRKFAKQHNVSHFGREIDDVITDLAELGLQDKMKYLNDQFRFSGTNLSIWKPQDGFPNEINSAEEFLTILFSKSLVNIDNVGTEWEPPLNDQIQLCSVFIDGSDVYIKMVEGKRTFKRDGYRREPSLYAHFTTAVLHFADKVLELRCSYSEREKYAQYLISLMGGVKDQKWIPLTILNKEKAKLLCGRLSAGVSSTHISIPTTVGSVRFNGKKNIDLSGDAWFAKLTDAISKLGLPTDDTMDETCFFSFTDPITNVVIEVSFEVNLKNGGFKFTKSVTEKVIEHVLDAYIYVCYTMDFETDEDTESVS